MIDTKGLERAQARVLAWFSEHGRRLEFRRTREPYRVLVAEVILQQTQAGRGEPACAAFLARFPDLRALAAASPAEVLRAWAGLGYNRRALNLRRAARTIVEEHGGRFPRSVADLEALPGVGPYTARAIAATAFGQPVGPVDTNVRRVLGRVLAGHGSPRDRGRSIPARDLQAIADRLATSVDPAAWTAALMDIGAVVCRPRRPMCEACPLSPDCAFAAAQRKAGATAGDDGRPERSETRRRPATAKGVRFAATSRWLRGRIVDRLCKLPDGAWTVLAGPLGEHDAQAVEDALAALVREGLVERGLQGAVRLPHGVGR